MQSKHPPTLFLSPHLDDVALSCGGQIARAEREGEPPPIVLTLFAGDEPSPAQRSDLASSFHRTWGVDTGVVARRREEDRRCCQRLGAEPRHWSFQDSIYRRDPDSGTALYSDIKELFGPPHPIDEELIDEIAQRLVEMAPPGRVVAPLAVGGHVDHRVVHLAAERCFGAELEYYEDFPYVAEWGALRRTLRSGGSWRSRVLPLSTADVEVKIEALTAFESQERTFGGFAKLARKVRRRSRRLGGERVWLHEVSGLD